MVSINGTSISGTLTCTSWWGSNLSLWLLVIAPSCCCCCCGSGVRMSVGGARSGRLIGETGWSGVVRISCMVSSIVAWSSTVGDAGVGGEESDEDGARSPSRCCCWAIFWSKAWMSPVGSCVAWYLCCCCCCCSRCCSWRNWWWCCCCRRCSASCMSLCWPSPISWRRGCWWCCRGSCCSRWGAAAAALPSGMNGVKATKGSWKEAYGIP